MEKPIIICTNVNRNCSNCVCVRENYTFEKREKRNILWCRLKLSEVDSNDCCHLFKAR